MWSDIDQIGPLDEGSPFDIPEHAQYNAQRARSRYAEPETARLARQHGLTVWSYPAQTRVHGAEYDDPPPGTEFSSIERALERGWRGALETLA
jgi:hypothetical protein